MFSNIVVAVDGSEHAAHAIATACDIAGKYDSNIHLVHSPQVDTVGFAVGSGAYVLEPGPERIKAAGQKVMDEAAALSKKQGRAPKTTTIGNGDPAKEILNCAEANDADLIVMGRRGLGTMGNLFLGSVSGKVSHETTCACLTVK
ncbi:universal stress protein [Lentilitoribacter sp. EG35]|uniref:universal stress protein n=1 Tax=Lentilitoribacter sp. EG35 TaxID=3234192 RepID=UPI0034611BDB